jgi:hypothetical protein
MSGFMAALRSVSQGRAAFTMEFSASGRREAALIKRKITLKNEHELISVHKAGYFMDRYCIFSPKDCENN